MAARAGGRGAAAGLRPRAARPGDGAGRGERGRLLSACPDWPGLAGPGRPPEEARARMRALLSPFAVTRLPPPRAPGAAVVVGASRDGFVPPDEARRVAGHWGAELRWIDGGHASALLLGGAELRRAVKDAFGRL